MLTRNHSLCSLQKGKHGAHIWVFYITNCFFESTKRTPRHWETHFVLKVELFSKVLSSPRFTARTSRHRFPGDNQQHRAPGRTKGVYWPPLPVINLPRSCESPTRSAPNSKPTKTRQTETLLWGFEDPVLAPSRIGGDAACIGERIPFNHHTKCYKLRIKG